jgi:hypothetical protein
MMFDYTAETPPSEFVNPPTLLNCIGLPADQVKLLNFQAKLSDIWQSTARGDRIYPRKSKGIS